MSLILHLSDLHLGPVERDDVIGDYKNDIVSLADRQSRQGLLKETLEKLNAKLRSEGQVLGAIVLTGDVTIQNSEKGFEQLKSYIDCLADIKPPPEKIVVVPGNHDVAWGAKTAADRYKQFLRFTRSEGYTTPLLEGIDLVGGKLTAAQLRQHYVLSDDKTWAILPINSSDYCGRLTPVGPLSDDLWEKIPSLLQREDPSLKPEEIQRMLYKLRMHDIARISKSQFAGMELILDDIASRAERDVVVVAAIHHHLLPVTAEEEFKSFESITNLGKLREIIRQKRISVVLHGHKHKSHEYVDHIYGLPKSGSRDAFKTLVISGASIGAKTYMAECVCRLISLAGQPRAPALKLTDVPAMDTGLPLEFLREKVFTLWQEEDRFIHGERNTVGVIEGATINDVYDRMHVFPLKGVTFDLVCRIQEPAYPTEIPEKYPPIPNVDSDAGRKNWFTQRVNWWQKHEFKKLHREFRLTHGNRIYSYGTGFDQLNSVISILSHKPKSSRAVVTLLMPDAGDLEVDATFPCFCFVHFVMRERENDVFLLDVLAYFRKQEMKYWWPINVAELALLQNKVIQGIAGDISNTWKKNVRRGAITTITAEARTENRIPGILIPVLDYDFEETPSKLWKLISTVNKPPREDTDRRQAMSEWQLLIAALRPKEEHDIDSISIPIQGLIYMAEITEHYCGSGGRLAKLGTELRELADLNQRHYKRIHARGARSSTDISAHHVNWRNAVNKILNEIEKLVGCGTS